MRKLVALVLALVTITVGTPAFAQAPAALKNGSVAGESVDAAGRAIAGQRVELLRAGEVVQTTATDSRGDWVFTNVPAGEYVVRMNVNGQIAGVRATVTAGQSTKALIVTSSAAAAKPAFLLALGLLGGLAAGAAVTAIVVTTVVVATGS
jgi:hypothetical protein